MPEPDYTHSRDDFEQFDELRMYRSRDSRDFIGWEDKLVTLLEQKPAIVL